MMIKPHDSAPQTERVHMLFFLLVLIIVIVVSYTLGHVGKEYMGQIGWEVRQTIRSRFDL